MALKITPIKFEEIADLVSVSRETFYDTFHQQNSKEDLDLFLNSSFNDAKLHIELSDAYNHFFFAKEDNEIAGYLKLSTATTSILQGTVVEISRVYVLIEKLKSGVGKALMEFTFSFARSKNATAIFLGVWEHNKKAIDFYTRFGFEKFGEHVFMVGNDAQTDWLMKVDLA